jgi:hypothetical protein
MYTSLDWINELVSLETVQLNDLIDKLTLGGFEVEETLEIEINKQKKTVLDISATANPTHHCPAKMAAGHTPQRSATRHTR